MIIPSHLKSLQALDLVVRKGSFKQAAAELGLTAAAVGQRVKVLEDFLGIALIERARTGIRPTAELAAALPHLRQGFDSLAAASGELDLQRGAEIHIAAVSDFVELWLMPRLDRFRVAHPMTRFSINGEGDAPLRLGRIDCRIDFGASPTSDEDDLLFHDFVVPIASQENVERTSALDPFLRLEGFPLLHIDFYKDDPAGLSWQHWIDRNAVERTAPERGLRFRRLTAALDAIDANAGIGLAGLALLEHRLSDGSIALPYPVSTGQWSGHAFVAHFRGDGPRRPNVVKFRDWLLSESERTRLWLIERASGGSPTAATRPRASASTSSRTRSASIAATRS